MIYNGKPKLVVAGNGTIDTFVEGQISIDGAKVIVESIWGNANFTAEDPPIRLGKKQRANENLDTIVNASGLLHRHAPGGGGINSLTAITQLQEGASDYTGEKVDLVYLDVSNPNPSVIEGLRRLNVKESFYFWRRDMPTNVVLKYGNDRIILKGHELRRYSPIDSDGERIEPYIEGSRALLINGAKDREYVELWIQIAQQHKVPVLSAITPSLPWSFVYEKVLPNSEVVVLSFEDLAESRGFKTVPDLDPKILSQAYMVHALETLEEIRRNHPKKEIYITLGSNGVYCFNGEGIFHVTLAPDYTGGVAYTSNGNPGAGDYFFGAVGFLEATSRGLSIIEKAKKGSEVALRHIGYWGPLPREAFRVQEVSRSSLRVA